MKPQDARLRRKAWLGAALLLLLLAASLAWQFGGWRTPATLSHGLAQLRVFAQSWGPAPSLIGLSLALSLAVPLTLLTVLSLAVFGPWTGACYVLIAAQCAAALSHTAGCLLGRELLQRLAGPRVLALSRWLGEQGLKAVITARLLPVAPFAVVNMVAGATHIRLLQMLLGTLIGMLPGTVLMALFLPQLLDAMLAPR